MKIHNEGMQFNISFHQNREESSELLYEGQILRGKISKILGNLIFLDLGKGETLEAKLTAPLPLQPGQLCDFLVKEVKDHQVLMKPITEDTEQANAAEKKIVSLLEKMGLAPDKEKIEIVKEMIRFQLPIQGSTIKEAASAKTAYEKVAEGIHQLPLEDKHALIEKPIQEVFKRVLNTDKELQLTVKDGGWGQEAAAEMNRFREKIIDVPPSPIEEKTSHNALKKHENIIEVSPEKSSKQEAAVGEKINAAAKEGISANLFNLQNMNYEKILFLLKNNFQMNIQNATQVNQILFHAAPVGKQLEEIVAALKEHKEMEDFVKNLGDIGSRIKPSLLQNKESVKEVVRELYNNIQSIKELIENGTVKVGKEVVQQLDSLKNGIDFMNKLNHYQGFLQLPIQIGGEQRNLEIVLCNKRKTQAALNPSDLKIFISLDTKSMDTVQAFIEIKEKNLTVNFRLMNEQIKNYMLQHENKLQSGLTDLGFTKIDIRYGTFKDRLNLITVLEQEALLSQRKHNFVDMWV